MTSLDKYKEIQEEALYLFTKKNTDYGDGFKNYGTIGVLVRMGDKINRLQSITNSSVNLVKTESLRDTLIDLHNYAAMAIICLDEKTSHEKPEKKLSISDLVAGC